VLYCDAPLDVLRQRVAARSARGTDRSDADLDVLEQQRDKLEPPTEAAIRVDTGGDIDPDQLRELCRRVVSRA
jgi:predicted kinase